MATGDIGSVDAGGWLTVVDRRKLVIVRGGANVYPAEDSFPVNAMGKIIRTRLPGLPGERPAWSGPRG